MNIYTLFALILGLSIGAALAYRLPTRRATDAPISSGSQADAGFKPSLDLLNHMTAGIIVLDERLRPDFTNTSARQLLGLTARTLPTHLPSPPVTEIARAARDDAEPKSDLVEVSFPARLTLHVQATPLTRPSQVMVVLQDVSEEVRLQKVRREFVAHASHELKSPVASVQALTEAVIQALGDDPAQATRFAERLLAESDRMGKLVTDLLDLSRLEEPGDPPQRPCDLSQIANKETDQVEGDAAERRLVLTRAIERDLMVMGDEGQFRLLVRNLLDNAVHYTPEGGKVHVEARRAGDSVLVRVEDTGIGIPLEAQPRVFERFYRVDRARSRARGGTGLGLAIVKHVAELHGGKIDLQSEVGRGSVFEVAFPRGQAMHPKKESA